MTYQDACPVYDRLVSSCTFLVTTLGVSATSGETPQVLSGSTPIGATSSHRRPLLREDLQERATAALANLLLRGQCSLTRSQVTFRLLPLKHLKSKMFNPNAYLFLHGNVRRHPPPWSRQRTA